MRGFAIAEAYPGFFKRITEIIMEKTKDVVIGDHTFRIGRVRADLGNWIVWQFQNGDFRKESVFPTVQAYMFDVCFRMKPVGGPPNGMMPGGAAQAAQTMPVKCYDAASRRWLIPDLADDIWTVSNLFNEAIDFNFADFFRKLGTKKPQEGEALDTPQLPSLQA